MLWKIYTSLISFHTGVNFIVGGMNFWWTFWGSPGIHSHLLGIFFFSDALLKFLQWIIVSEEFKVFTSKKTKQTKQSIRLAGMLLTLILETQFVLVESIFGFLLITFYSTFANRFKWTGELPSLVCNLKIIFALSKKKSSNNL